MHARDIQHTSPWLRAQAHRVATMDPAAREGVGRASSVPLRRPRVSPGTTSRRARGDDVVADVPQTELLLSSGHSTRRGEACVPPEACLGRANDRHVPLGIDSPPGPLRASAKSARGRACATSSRAAGRADRSSERPTAPAKCWLFDEAESRDEVDGRRPSEALARLGPDGPSVGFRGPTTCEIDGSDSCRACLTRLRSAFRLSQPLDALLRLRPFRPCFVPVTSMGFRSRRLSPFGCGPRLSASLPFLPFRIASLCGSLG